MRIHVFVSGQVQGVFFRDFVKSKADSLDVKGWVKNNSDGTVECVCDGNEEVLKEMEKCLREGSNSSNVSGILLKIEKGDGELNSFQIRY